MTKPQDIKPLPTDSWSDDLASIVADMNGAPIAVHRLMAHSPALLRAWWDYRNFSVKGGTLGPRLGELVILRVAVHLGSWYEWASHVDRATRIGLPLHQIAQVARRGIGPDWCASEAAVLRGVDDLMTRRRITPDTRAALEAELETAQIMDLIAIHGMYVTLGCMIGTWGLALDQDVADRIAGLTDEATFADAAAAFAASPFRPSD